MNWIGKLVVNRVEQGKVGDEGLVPPLSCVLFSVEKRETQLSLSRHFIWAERLFLTLLKSDFVLIFGLRSQVVNYFLQLREASQSVCDIVMLWKSAVQRKIFTFKLDVCMILHVLSCSDLLQCCPRLMQRTLIQMTSLGLENSFGFFKKSFSMKSSSI